MGFSWAISTATAKPVPLVPTGRPDTSTPCPGRCRAYGGGTWANPYMVAAAGPLAGARARQRPYRIITRRYSPGSAARHGGPFRPARTGTEAPPRPARVR
ncbi:hypothetical protein GCM10022225_43610 [Plantactinospora mayteni]|uniref:Uncharacterized protein n=1 Tax=Plantactinospora mayteni TaxID=566021 RepID=A0ABQ4ES42_9ACTN|nr:hypothetical protein Pma05_40020 [Plantactinospora mayteni]